MLQPGIDKPSVRRLVGPLAVCALLAALAVVAGPARAAEPAGWPALERVELQDGRQYEGLVESEDELWVNFLEIRRPAGRPMHLVLRPLERSAVATLQRQPPATQDLLRRHVERFVQRARIEAANMQAVRLGLRQADGNSYRNYRGRWFTLDATTDESTTRRIAIRLEQVFGAYRQLLAPRVWPETPPRILVFGALEEYRGFLAGRGIRFDNPACFIPHENLLVAGSELSRYRAELARVSAAHEQLRAELERLEKQLAERLQGYGKQLRDSGRPKTDIARLLNLEKQKSRKQIEDKQRQVQASDRQNAQEFDKVAAQMFTRLYHEAFHAYLEDYVYPQRDYAVPAWLQEGLAVMVEEGILEDGALRIDAPHREALRQLKADLGGPTPVSLAALVETTTEDYHRPVGGGAAAAASQRYYAAAWGLTYYLAFERNLLGREALDAYVQKAAARQPAIGRFEQLAGEPLAEFEKAWRAAMLNLRSP